MRVLAIVGRFDKRPYLVYMLKKSYDFADIFKNFKSPRLSSLANFIARFKI